MFWLKEKLSTEFLSNKIPHVGRVVEWRTWYAPGTMICPYTIHIRYTALSQNHRAKCLVNVSILRCSDAFILLLYRPPVVIIFWAIHRDCVHRSSRLLISVVTVRSINLKRLLLLFNAMFGTFYAPGFWLCGLPKWKRK